MATSSHTSNYNLSQYASGDPVKFLTNYNQDMAAIDAAVKAASDSAAAKVPLTRTIAGLPLLADISLAQLLAAGLCSAPVSGTWTPTIFGESTPGTPTVTTASGRFCKTGNLVHLYGLIGISNKGGMAGHIGIGGLPFVFNIMSVQLDFSHGFNLASGLPYGGSGGTSFYIFKAMTYGIDIVEASDIQDDFQLQFEASGAVQ